MLGNALLKAKMFSIENNQNVDHKSYGKKRTYTHDGHLKLVLKYRRPSVILIIAYFAKMLQLSHGELSYLYDENVPFFKLSYSPISSAGYQQKVILAKHVKKAILLDRIVS